MKRVAQWFTGSGVCALSALVMLGSVVPAQAATSTDTFELKVVTKEWCEGNPKFFENFTVKIDPKNPAGNMTLTFIRDVNGDDVDVTDVRVTINTKGGSADVDAIAMNGLAFFSNKAQSKAEFAVSGVNPTNDDHFMTIRGQASFDKLGNLTKLTGTFVLMGTGTYTVDKKTGQQSDDKECFDSGTIGTGKKL